MNLQLVDDAKKAWKWLSVQMMLLAGAVQGTWAVFSDDLKQNVPHWVITTLTLGLLAAGVGGRMVKQGKPKDGGSNE